MQNEFYKLSLSLAPRQQRARSSACLWKINARSETKHNMHAPRRLLYCCIVLKNTHNRSLRIIGLKLPRITRHLTPRWYHVHLHLAASVFMFNVILYSRRRKTQRWNHCMHLALSGTWMYARDARLNSSIGASLFFLQFRDFLSHA